MNRILSAWFLILVIYRPLSGQEFTNLDFESARIVIINGPGSSSSIYNSNAVPGWSVFDAAGPPSSVPYNDNYGAGPDFAPFGLEASNQWVLDGNISFYVGPGIGIGQAGLVPSGAESLLFDATSSSVLVSLGGQNLSFVAISNAVNASGLGYTVYGANISGFAGQVETLTFFKNNQYANFDAGVGLDDIRFSPQAIPEPSAAALICLGSGILFYVRRRKRYRL